MGATRSNRHKTTKTGAKKSINKSKRKNNIARPASNTKIGKERIKSIRCRGGNRKQRALRLNEGNFECLSHKFVFRCPINQVVYHPSSNELMRTNTLTKGAIVKIESHEFRAKFQELLDADPSFKEVDPLFFDLLMEKETLYGKIITRPGQEGKADGFILQGEELKFYTAKMSKKK